MITKLYEKEFGAVKATEKTKTKSQQELPAPKPQKIEVAEEQKSKPSNEDKKRKSYFGEEEQDVHDNNTLFDDRKKADIFDTSKDHINKQQASLNDKQKKDSKKDEFNLQPDQAEEEVEVSEEEQKKAIEKQFQMLYDQDPELRKVLEKSDVTTFTVTEKYSIIEAYIAGGGAQGLQIELEGEEDSEMTEETLEQMSPEEKKQLDEQFMTLFKQDPVLKQVLGEDPAGLTLF